MQTGLIENWSGQPSEVGPLYPFVGSEMLFFVICVILWILWTLWQIRSENKQCQQENQVLQEPNRLKQAIEER